MAANVSYLLFPLGQIVMTPNAADALADSGESPITFIAKHASLNRGDLCEDDHKANIWSLQNEARILSSFKLASGVKLWVISEADRSSTCLLLPSDY